MAAPALDLAAVRCRVNVVETGLPSSVPVDESPSAGRRRARCTRPPCGVGANGCSSAASSAHARSGSRIVPPAGSQSSVHVRSAFAFGALVRTMIVSEVAGVSDSPLADRRRSRSRRPAAAAQRAAARAVSWARMVRGSRYTRRVALTGKRILITGGAGFIGTTLARRLVDANEIVAYDNLHRDALGGTDLADHPNFTFVAGRRARRRTRLRERGAGRDAHRPLRRRSRASTPCSRARCGRCA